MVNNCSCLILLLLIAKRSPIQKSGKATMSVAASAIAATMSVVAEECHTQDAQGADGCVPFAGVFLTCVPNVSRHYNYDVVSL